MDGDAHTASPTHTCELYVLDRVLLYDRLQTSTRQRSLLRAVRINRGRERIYFVCHPAILPAHLLSHHNLEP